jgi:hypothetical protein
MTSTRVCDCDSDNTGCMQETLRFGDQQEQHKHMETVRQFDSNGLPRPPVPLPSCRIVTTIDTAAAHSLSPCRGLLIVCECGVWSERLGSCNNRKMYASTSSSLLVATVDSYYLLVLEYSSCIFLYISTSQSDQPCLYIAVSAACALSVCGSHSTPTL